MALESRSTVSQECVEMPLYFDTGIWRADWSPLLPVLMDQDRSIEERATCFHASLARVILRQAERVRQAHGIGLIGLTGGVFQNRILTEQTMDLLADAGFEALLPERLPVNDAAISFGQIVESAVEPG
jgi:hydrogenase maturation protein HypF